VNLALNPDFEDPDPGVPLGSETCWQMGDPTPPPSAAAHWLMHSSNPPTAATVCSRLVPSTAPGPHGKWMLKFTATPAGGPANESGPVQFLTGPFAERSGWDETKSYMFSVWVFVRRGRVSVSSYTMTGLNQVLAWSTKRGEWEQLRVCTNSRGLTNVLLMWNQIESGGEFFVDRVELREIPTVE
jgi:hypothetical protein